MEKRIYWKIKLFIVNNNIVPAIKLLYNKEKITIFFKQTPNIKENSYLYIWFTLLLHITVTILYFKKNTFNNLPMNKLYT